MNDNEATLKDVIIAVIDYKNELKRRFVLILSVIILFTAIGYWYASSKKEKYTATLSFIIEGNSDGSSLSSLSGMANQFGFDFGGGGSASSFSQQNVVELLKSRKIIESTLNKECLISGGKYSLLNYYITLNNLIEDSASVNFSGLYTDSIKNVIWKQVVNNRLDISYQNDDANILNLNYSSTDSEFAKYFTETLVEEMSKMYSSYQTEKTRISLDNLENRLDSVFAELKISERNLARVKDRNIRVVNASGRLDEIQYMREVQVLNAMYLELIKNTELVKMNLLNETPIIQVIDRPILPLSSFKRPYIFWMFLFSCLGFSIISFMIIIRKIIKDTMREDD